MSLLATLASNWRAPYPGLARHNQQTFARNTPYAVQQKLGTLEKQLIGPLKRLDPSSDVRLVLDGLDRLSTGALGPVMAALDELAKLDFMRLVITARPDTKFPEAASISPLPRAPDAFVRRYLDRRGAPEARQGNIVDAARGNWLVARVLADVLVDRPDTEIREAGQLALYEAYEELLSRCGAIGNNYTERLLQVLAAAGAGPMLPLSLMCEASEAVGGPASPVAVRDHLVQLRGLAVRSAAGTDREHAGLFHDTLAEYVESRAPDQNLSAHRALLAAITALAPAASGPTDLSDLAQMYAFELEAEHLWALGEIGKALQSLSARSSPASR